MGHYSWSPPTDKLRGRLCRIESAKSILPFWNADFPTIEYKCISWLKFGKAVAFVAFDFELS